LPLASSYSQSTDIVGNEVFPRWADTNTIEKQAASEVIVNASQKTERQEGAQQCLQNHIFEGFVSETKHRTQLLQ
jgi:hypothetical protein